MISSNLLILFKAGVDMNKLNLIYLTTLLLLNKVDESKVRLCTTLLDILGLIPKEARINNLYKALSDAYFSNTKVDFQFMGETYKMHHPAISKQGSKLMITDSSELLTQDLCYLPNLSAVLKGFSTSDYHTYIRLYSLVNKALYYVELKSLVSHCPMLNFSA